jgi:hypothetical protein
MITKRQDGHRTIDEAVRSKSSKAGETRGDAESNSTDLRSSIAKVMLQTTRISVLQQHNGGSQQVHKRYFVCEVNGLLVDEQLLEGEGHELH